MGSLQVNQSRHRIGNDFKEVVLPFAVLAANGVQALWRPATDVLIEGVRFGGNAGPTADATGLCLFAHPASDAAVPPALSGVSALRRITSGQTVTSGGRITNKVTADSAFVASVSGQNSGTGAPQYNLVKKGDEICVGATTATTGATQAYVVIRYREVEEARIAASMPEAYDAFQ